MGQATTTRRDFLRGSGLPLPHNFEVPDGARVKDVRLLVGDRRPGYEIRDGTVTLTAPSILDHEVLALDLRA